MMTVEEKPDVSYDDVGGAKDSLEQLREVVEMPLLYPERFVSLGIDPPKVRSAALLQDQSLLLGGTNDRNSAVKSCRCSLIDIKPDVFRSVELCCLGCLVVRSTRNRQNAVCPSSRQPNRCLFHPCNRYVRHHMFGRASAWVLGVKQASRVCSRAAVMSFQASY